MDAANSFMSPADAPPPSVATGGLTMPLSPGDAAPPSVMAPPSIQPPQSVHPPQSHTSHGGGQPGSNRPSESGTHSILPLFPPMTPRNPNMEMQSGVPSVGFGNPLSVHPHSSIHAVVPHTPAADQIPRPQLQNIVSTVNLGCKLDLKHIALHARNAEYNPKRFAAVIMRIREPRTTALIFSSGKMVCTGAKSEDQSRLAARKYARIVQKLGFEARFMDFKVQNMVGSCDVKFPIQLESLCLTHTQFSTYEPELFPGLIYKMVKPRVVLLIFVSGKVVITGAKERADIDEAFTNIYPILKGFRKS